MTKYFLNGILIFSIFISCNSIKPNINEVKGKPNIIKVAIVKNKDTTKINELRFYKISSAINTMQLLFDNYGKWNNEINGRYQKNIPQLIWKNIKIIDSINNYTIVASGTETRYNYFATIMIFDTSNNDCLDNNNPNRLKFMEYFSNKMSQLNNKPTKFHKVYKSRNKN
jgi:hypothetical protein